MRRVFLGKHIHTVDNKGRMIVPAGFREDLGDQFVISRGLDTCITIYPKERWTQMTERLQSLSTLNKKVREIIRYIIGSASIMECDKQGRILIPAHLREAAQIKKEAVVIGTGDKIEIWSKEVLHAQEEASESISDIAESLDLPIDFSF